MEKIYGEIIEAVANGLFIVCEMLAIEEVVCGYENVLIRWRRKYTGGYYFDVLVEYYFSIKNRIIHISLYPPRLSLNIVLLLAQ